MDVEGIGKTRATGEARVGQFMHLGPIKPEGVGKREGSRRNVPNSGHMTRCIYSIGEGAIAAGSVRCLVRRPAQVILRYQGRVSGINAERVWRPGELYII